MQAADRVRQVQETIARACEKAGRQREDITLVAVTKFVEEARILEVLQHGVWHVGENRAQEFAKKQPFFRAHGCTTHFIGQLQTNKVKYVLGQADLIQSVDRVSLLEEMHRQAAGKGLKQDILIEVNIGAEVQKGGVLPAEVPALLTRMQDMPHLHVCGLMCIPPALEGEKARPYFQRMRALFEDCKRFAHVQMRCLSMGMSGDFGVAIEEGANMVRVGSALFGPRM